MYHVLVSNKAEKDLANIPVAARSRIILALRKLSINPRPPGCKKLKGRDAWRIRLNDYRAIYEIEDKELIVRVVSLGHRKDIYK